MTINLLEPEVKTTTVWQRSSPFITCLFCGLRGRQVGDSPLCSNCLIDPVQTRTALYLQLKQIELAEARIGADWLVYTAQHADDWDRLRKAWRDMSAEAYAARCADHRARGTRYGALLDRYDAYLTALQPLSIERARLETAERVLGEL